MREVLLETAAFKLERATKGFVPVEHPRWIFTVKTPDGVAVLGKEGLIRLYEIVVRERALIVP